MWVILFLVCTIVCGFGWLNQYVMNRAILKWILDRHESLPGKEIRDDLTWAWKHTLGLK